jgi:plastocyanin domain-containing protein
MLRAPLSALASAALLALALPGCSKPGAEAEATQPAAPAQASQADAPIPKDAKRIEIAVTDEGFSPASIDVKKGETVVLRFNRTTKSECLKAIEIPDLGIKKDLPMNTPVEVAITPQKEGKMVLQCWMAMVKASINVS